MGARGLSRAWKALMGAVALFHLMGSTLGISAKGGEFHIPPFSSPKHSPVGAVCSVAQVWLWGGSRGWGGAERKSVQDCGPTGIQPSTPQEVPTSCAQLAPFTGERPWLPCKEAALGLLQLGLCPAL